MAAFPKFVYYSDGSSKLVHSQKELDALKAGWKESPADHQKPMAKEPKSK